jgi:molybdate transport system substrate-binding protein
MAKKSFSAVLFIAAAIAAVYLLVPKKDHNKPSLLLYAGAGLRPAVEQLITAFKSKTGLQIEADYGGSGEVLSRVREDKKADLFMPGDGWYVDRLQELSGCVTQRKTIAYFVPVIIVEKGNPKNVHGLSDFARPDLRVGVGDSKSCQVGRVTLDMLKKAGVNSGGANFQQSLTVNELGIWVKMKSVDAAVVWDALAESIASDVDIIHLPPGQIIISEVVLAQLKQSHNPKAVKKFMEFTVSDEGKRILRGAGYSVDKP